MLGGRIQRRALRACRTGRARVRAPSGHRRPFVVRRPISPIARGDARGRSAGRRRSSRVRPPSGIRPPGSRPPGCRPPGFARRALLNGLTVGRHFIATTRRSCNISLCS